MLHRIYFCNFLLLLLLCLRLRVNFPSNVSEDLSAKIEKMFPYTVIIVLILSIIGAILQIPLIIYYIKIKNIPIVFLASWFFLICIISFLSIIIWQGDNTEYWWNGYVFCDVVVRLRISYSCGVLCATCAIARNLSRILVTKNPRLNNNSFSSRLVDIVICSVMPLLLFSLVYIVQDRRYMIYQYQGCTLTVTSWVRIPLILIWPTIWALVASGYIILTLYRFHHKNKDMKDFLHTSGSNLTRIQIVRFVSCCAIIVATILPFSIDALIINVNSLMEMPFSWSDIHNPLLWNVILKLRSSGPSTSQYFDIPLSIITFICFGTSKEVNTWYRQLAHEFSKLIHRFIQWLSHPWNRELANMVPSLNAKFGRPASAISEFSPTSGYGPQNLLGSGRYLTEHMSEIDWHDMMELSDIKRV